MRFSAWNKRITSGDRDGLRLVEAFQGVLDQDHVKPVSLRDAILCPNPGQNIYTMIIVI